MEITRIFELLDRYKTSHSAKEDAFAAKLNGEWQKVNAMEYVQKAHMTAYGLLDYGLQPGDKIATISNNRPEWNFMDMGMSMAGLIHVPIYPTVSDSDFDYILRHSQPKLVIVSDKPLFDRLKPMVQDIDDVEEILTFNEVEGARNWTEILQTGIEKQEQYKDELERIKSSIKPDQMATLIYTSGTTDNPKGVMLSHENIVSNLRSIEKVFHFTSCQRTLSFLPISHVFERTINYYFQYKGLGIYYAESLGTIAQNLQEVSPNVIIAVPRVLERLYDRILGKGKDLKGIKKQLFFWAVNLGLRYRPYDKHGFLYKQQLKLANKLIFSKWREALGGQIELIVAGGAALQPRLMKVFNAAGIPLVEGYGMTETAPVIAANDFYQGQVRVGTVGPPLPGIDVKISEEGEILTKSPCVMMGYYNEPELTREAVDEEGWMHTGDIGTFEEGKFLKITDRKKEIFKLSSGKYISPQAIENKFKESFFIEQLMVVGENQKFASALIAPNFQFLHDWCARHGVKYRDNKELIQNETVIKRFQREVREMNAKLGQTEQIKRFRLVHEEWSPQTRELSPTLKLRRKFIREKYRVLLDEIFSVEQN